MTANMFCCLAHVSKCNAIRHRESGAEVINCIAACNTSFDFLISRLLPIILTSVICYLFASEPTCLSAISEVEECKASSVLLLQLLS